MDPEVIDDRRAAIEAAFEAEEKETPEVVAPEVPAKETPEVPAKETPEVPAKETPEVPAKETPEVPETSTPGERAPQSWKASTKAQWDKLPADVRQEIARREHQTSSVLNESAQARKIATELQQAVQPYMARLQSAGITPTQAVQELLKSDHLLSTAPKVSRAQYMAKMIKDYDVDLVELDNALSGNIKPDPESQVNRQVEQLLAQRLSPYQALLQREQQRTQMEEQQLAQTVSSYSNNPQYPYFDQLREEMADLIEISARRGAPLTIEQAYNKAILLDPVVSQEVAAKTEQAQKAERAAKANAQAQRALKASVSVGGAPSTGLLGTPEGNDRRSTIAAAFDSLGSR